MALFYILQTNYFLIFMYVCICCPFLSDRTIRDKTLLTFLITHSILRQNYHFLHGIVEGYTPQLHYRLGKAKRL